MFLDRFKALAEAMRSQFDFDSTTFFCSKMQIVKVVT